MVYSVAAIRCGAWGWRFPWVGRGLPDGDFPSAGGLVVGDGLFLQFVQERADVGVVLGEVGLECVQGLGDRVEG